MQRATMRGMDTSATERKVFVTLSAGSEEGSTIHHRIWEIPPEYEERFAALMLEGHGEPLELVSDATDSPDLPRHVFYKTSQ